ncbi:MAG: hypothetical protein IKN68_03870 [Spirochaetia bacterium]|nr:hypothetical protein [Spirochaetia bacterium]
MKKILKRALVLVLCAMFFAACGTTEKSATADGTKEEKVAKSDKQAAKEKQKAEKQKAKEKKKAGKSKEAKSGSYLVPINEAIASGDYDDAYTMLSDETNKVYLGSDDVYNMDAGMVKLYANDNNAAITHLQPVADMKKLQEKYAGADKVVLSTFFADEYSQPYVTYDYEDIYAIIFDAVAKLDSDDEAVADAAFQDLMNIREMLKAMEVYNETLSAKMDEAGKLGDGTTKNLPKPANIVYHNSALANYLALIYNKYNTDREGDQRAFFYGQMEESYKQESYEGQSMPATAAAEKESVPAGKARLNVLALAGLMAQKIEHGQDTGAPTDFIASKMLENDQIKNANIDLNAILGKLSAFTTIRAVYTELADQPEIPPCIVTINGTKYTLDKIENTNGIAKKCIARKQYIASRRSVFRTSLKSIPLFISYVLLPDPNGIANPLAKKAAEASIGSAGDKIREALMNDHADIRGAHYYPAEVQATGIELDPGTYEVVITFPGQEPIVCKDVKVKAGQLNLLTVECPR